MTDYWQNRANKFKTDIEHIKAKMQDAPEDELQQLKKQKQHLTEELMICMDAVEKFKQNQSA